jgi:hypothetical protein
MVPLSLSPVPRTLAAVAVAGTEQRVTPVLAVPVSSFS